MAIIDPKTGKPVKSVGKGIDALNQTIQTMIMHLQQIDINIAVLTQLTKKLYDKAGLDMSAEIEEIVKEMNGGQDEQAPKE